MGDAKAGSRSTRAGTKRSIRRRAVGTRDKIISHLATVDEINDPAGMASTRLAEAVGYPGSSVAFAQLLSGMERDGLIVREIRGKRTYRITLPEDALAGADGAPGTGLAGRGPGEAGLAGTGGGGLGTGLGSAAMTATGQAGGLSAAGFGGALAASAGVDYDELARRLLVQVVRRLASTSLPNAAADLATVDVPGAVAESRQAERTDGTETEGTAPGDLGSGDAGLRDADSPDTGSRDTERAALQQTVVGLESELATAWSRHGSLTAENARLREQLREAQRDLARERTRRAQITNELNQAEVILLERLLSPAPEDEEKHPDAATN